MFFVTQFPFSDMRRFVETPTGRLANPTWPMAQVNKEFIRSTGVVRRRPGGGLDTWVGEEHYGDASSALRFPSGLRHIPLDEKKNFGGILHGYRRFHSDGVAARMEVGMVLDGGHQSRRPILPLIRRILKLRVGVGKPEKVEEKIKLCDAGKMLAKHFLDATTSHSKNPDVDVKSWWFSSGAPAVIVEYSEPVVLPERAQEVLRLDRGKIILSHFWFEEIEGKSVSVWLLESNGGDPGALRNLRVHLSRLHAERESLQLVIRKMNEEKLSSLRGSLAFDFLQDYLNNTLRVLNRSERFGHDQVAMLNAAREAFSVALVGETNTLLLMRGQVIAKLLAYVECNSHLASPVNHIYQGDVVNNVQVKNVVVGKDFNMMIGGKVEGSFNRVATNDLNNLQDALKELEGLVIDLGKSLPPESAEKVSSDLQTLTKEATSKAPRDEWLKLSSNGLIDAAKTVAELAAPVTTAVGAVLALLAH